MREINSTAAEKLARKLRATSMAWARTFLICAGRRDASLELAVAAQVVAYSLCLFEERLRAFENAEVLVERVRARCRELHEKYARRVANRHRSWPAVLYGQGENLATLVFYIVVHVGVSVRAPLPRRQTAELLRAARECRLRLESFVGEWMADALGGKPAETVKLGLFARATGLPQLGPVG